MRGERKPESDCQVPVPRNGTIEKGVAYLYSTQLLSGQLSSWYCGSVSGIKLFCTCVNSAGVRGQSSLTRCLRCSVNATLPPGSS